MSLFLKHQPKPKLETRQNGEDINIELEILIASRRGQPLPVRNLLSQIPSDKISQLLNIQDENGSTSLILAVMRGHRDLVIFYLSCDADPNIFDNIGWTSLHWAIHLGFIEIACHLIKSGALIESKPSNAPSFAVTALEFAINKRFILVEQYLFKNREKLLRSNQYENIKQVLQRSRNEINPSILDMIYTSLLQKDFSQKEAQSWTFPAILSQKQQCCEFAARCLRDTPIAVEYGNIGIDEDDDDDDEELLDGSMYASDDEESEQDDEDEDYDDEDDE